MLQTQKIYLGNVPVIKNYLGENKIALNSFDSILIEYLVVGGGGSCRASSGGGGGGGQFVSDSTTIAINSSKEITAVGAGGIGLTLDNGGTTIFDSIEAIGGGYGGYASVNANSGSCGGGATQRTNTLGGIGLAGNDGGDSPWLTSSGGAGGGGGAGAPGGDSEGFTSPDIGGDGGDGGNGLQWVDGIYYCGGGGGGRYTGGSGSPSDGTVGLGGGSANYGGGGHCNDANKSGGAGIVKIRYAGTPVATGGTITEDGGYTYHTFTTTGTFTYTG